MSDLTDLDICKRIAEIEGYQTESFEGYECCAFKGDEHMKPHIGKYNFIPYNPLTDDRLCFQLMVKYKVSPFVNSDYTSVTNYEHNMTLARDENPNKAICLAIIEANGGK